MCSLFQYRLGIFYENNELNPLGAAGRCIDLNHSLTFHSCGVLVYRPVILIFCTRIALSLFCPGKKTELVYLSYNPFYRSLCPKKSKISQKRGAKKCLNLTYQKRIFLYFENGLRYSKNLNWSDSGILTALI